jgi:radical SAM superfamily enzyme YgiQ (UPF0313 family)
LNLTNKTIGYIVFGDNNLNYGINYILWKNNLTGIPATTKTAKYFDVLLVSVFWWQHVYDWYKFYHEAGLSIESKKPLIIIGGQNVTCNPVLFDGTAHVIVCGDGEDVLMDAINEKDHPSFYDSSKKQIIANHADISKNSFCYETEKKVGRIEVMRGCPYRCKFCQISHIKKCKYANVESIEFALKKTKLRRITMFAPNRGSHPEWEKINTLSEKYKKVDLNVDVRFNEIEKWKSNSSPYTGIEGISERLRFLVGKNMTDERWIDIIKIIIEKAKTRKVKPLFMMGFILDLPSESEDDYKIFDSFIDRINGINGIEKMTLFFIFNQFMPAPYTPFENEKINIGRNYPEKVKHWLRDGRQKKEFKRCLKSKWYSDYSRVLSLISTIGTIQDIPIIKEIAMSSSYRNSKLENMRKLEFLLKRHDSSMERYTENLTGRKNIVTF